MLDQQMLAALHLGDADARPEHTTTAATAHGPAQRLDMCTFTPHTGNVSTLNLMRVPLARESPPTKPVCSEKSDDKVGMASCSVVTGASIVTVSLVSRRAGFETLSATLRSHIERLFTPGSRRQ